MKIRHVLGLCFALGLLGVNSAQATSISLTATIRDFHASHIDFENAIAFDPGIVTSTLGLDGKPVYAGTAGNPTTHGAAAFNQWYNDTAGVNLKTTTTLVANETAPGSGIFAFSDSSFFPIDGSLFGNEGNTHNFHFTTEINTAFTYTGGENFSFTGDDDVWVFINDVLAIDLGGVHGPMSASVALDSFAAAHGMTLGNTYSLDIFQAERHTSGSNFAFTTSLALVDATPSVPEPATIALLGLGLAGIGFGRRKAA